MVIYTRASVSNQKGSAIVFALGLTVLVVALATVILSWLRFDIKRVDQLNMASERYRYLELSEHVMAKRLAVHIADEAYTNKTQDWAQAWVYEDEGYVVSAQLEDLTARLNINTLAQQDNPSHEQDYFYPKSVFERLATTFDVDVTFPTSQIYGISEHEISDTELKAYIFATQPGQQQVNINTTTPHVLAVVLGIEESEAESILAMAPFENFETIHAALKQAHLTYDPIEPVQEWLGIKSKHYLLKTCIERKRTDCAFSVFEIENDKPKIIHRSWGEMA